MQQYSAQLKKTQAQTFDNPTPHERVITPCTRTVAQLRRNAPVAKCSNQLSARDMTKIAAALAEVGYTVEQAEIGGRLLPLVIERIAAHNCDCYKRWQGRGES